jgi:hypothetical protein
MYELSIIATKPSFCRHIGGCETLTKYPINVPNPSHIDQANPTSDERKYSRDIKWTAGHKMYR